ncbi:MAG TPA: hypothetical protein VGG73_12485 [Vicinamibacterales bacterium]|jgi:hypothetical protein
MLSRWAAVVAGALTFLAAHAVEVVAWTTWFHGTRAPWFLNSSAAIAFTLGAVVVVSCLIVPSGLSAGQSRGLGFGLGATIAMTIVLFAGPGPGTIFPIVIVFGGTILVLASVVGTWLGQQVAKRLGQD